MLCQKFMIKLSTILLFSCIVHSVKIKKLGKVERGLINMDFISCEFELKIGKIYGSVPGSVISDVNGRDKKSPRFMVLRTATLEEFVNYNRENGWTGNPPIRSTYFYAISMD